MLAGTLSFASALAVGVTLLVRAIRKRPIMWRDFVSTGMPDDPPTEHA